MPDRREASQEAQDHFVSRGYQQNFATSDKRVAVIDAGSERMIDDGRPIRSNFREQGRTTFLEAWQEVTKGTAARHPSTTVTENG